MLPESATQHVDVAAVLSTWARTACGIGGVQAVYVFGSLVYKRGHQFDPQQSDVDLLVELADELDNMPVERTRVLASLATTKASLEAQLRGQLGRERTSPIVSVVIATKLELTRGIHKDGKPRFYADTEFYDLRTGAVRRTGPVAQSDLIVSNSVAALQGAQKFRNQYLRIDTSGNRHRDVDEPIPKGLRRAAAATAFDANPKGRQVQEKFDLNAGLLHLAGVVGAADAGATEVDRVKTVLPTLLGGRGDAEALTDDDVLLCWELLVQDAAPRLPPLPGKARPEPDGRYAFRRRGDYRLDGRTIPASEAQLMRSDAISISITALSGPKPQALAADFYSAVVQLGWSPSSQPNLLMTPDRVHGLVVKSRATTATGDPVAALVTWLRKEGFDVKYEPGAEENTMLVGDE